MIINNLDLRISDFVNVFLVSHVYHEPPAREIGQPLPVYPTVNKLYLYTYTYGTELIFVFHFLRVKPRRTSQLSTLYLGPWCLIIMMLFWWKESLKNLMIALECSRKVLCIV